MSQYDFGTIDPYTDDGVTLANMLNSWRDAIHSWHRGPSRPSYVVPGMAWINDNGGATNWLVNVYLSPTVGDVVLFTYDTTTGAISTGGGTVLAQATASPSVRWQATGNAANLKAWRATENPDGTLRFGAYNDAGVEVAGITFQRDGKLIADLSGSTGIPSPLVVGPTPPASPQPNQLWWNSDDSNLGGGRLYLYFVDVDTSQWVPASPPLGITWTVPPSSDASSVGTASGANYVAGGDTIMQITNGVQLFSRSFTASDPSHPIEVDASVWLYAPNASAAHGYVGLFVDGAANAVAQGVITAAAGSGTQCRLYWQSALAAGPHTFQLRLGSYSSSAIYTNTSDGGHQGGGAQRNSMVIREVGVGAVGPQGPAGPNAGVLQMQTATYNAPLNPAQAVLPYDNTPPQSTEGAPYMQVSITPQSATSRIVVEVEAMHTATGVNTFAGAIFKDSEASARKTLPFMVESANYAHPFRMRYELPSPGAGTAVLFKYRAGNAGAAALIMNGDSSGNPLYGGTLASTMTATEYSV
jgi:hypothetical protein